MPENETNEDGRSSYDDVAEMYHTLWARQYLPASLPALERLFFSRLSPRSRVLDLCCGSGHVTKELVARNYSVTGVDNSSQLLGFARRELPGVDFRAQDARKLALDCSFAAVLSTYDSLNHILSLDELKIVFRSVRQLLDYNGFFVFDLILDEVYSGASQEWKAVVNEERIGLIQRQFDSLLRRGCTNLVWFVRDDHTDIWFHRSASIEQQCYSLAEVVRTLNGSGFSSVEAVSAHELGVNSGIAFGRVYLSAAP